MQKQIFAFAAAYGILVLLLSFPPAWRPPRHEVQQAGECGPKDSYGGIHLLFLMYNV